VRVRSFELRLIGTALVACWLVSGGLILLAYRPGGPFDLIVGLTAIGPIVISVASVIWPPVARGNTAFAATVWLGIVGLLCLVPSIAGVVLSRSSRAACQSTVEVMLTIIKHLTG